MERNLTGTKAQAISTMDHAGGFRVARELTRRFREADEHIHGGITQTQVQRVSVL